MQGNRRSRRRFLERLAALSVVGATNALRARRPLAAESGAVPAASIPGVSGRVIRRSDDNYELWRQSMVWHLSKPDRRPDLIIQPRAVQEVSAAVRYAARQGHRVALRSGGHNATGASLREGGVLLDLSGLHAIEIDPARRIASVGPGARGVQLMSAAREHGLAFPVPHCPSVGLGGFVMGGGIGLNYGHRGGFATFSIDAAEMVTAEGETVRADAEHNADLYWAVRGAGPGLFAAVTRLDLRLYPAPRAIHVSSYIHSLEGVATVTGALEALMPVKDGRLEILALLLHDPQAPADAPPERSKICFVSAFAFADSATEAGAMLAPLARSPLAREALARVENQVFSFEKIYENFFSQNDPAGKMARYAVDNVMTDAPGEVLQALAGHFRRARSRDHHVLAAYGMNVRAHADACLSGIADHYVGCFAIWDREDEDALHFDWLDGTLPLMDPFARGHYINEVEARRHPQRLRLSFSPAAWQRLQALRRKYDPAGVFHTYLGHDDSR